VGFVLAIEPDQRQAGILRRLVRERVHGELLLVESKDAAVGAINARVPDLILVTTLMSPRDEEELVTHLKSLDGADHLQTLTIPLLAGSAKPEKESGGLLGAFRRRKSAQMQGCDPAVFAEEIAGYLRRAQETKAEIRALKEIQFDQAQAQAAQAALAEPAEPAPAPVDDPWRPHAEWIPDAPPSIENLRAIDNPQSAVDTHSAFATRPSAFEETRQSDLEEAAIDRVLESIVETPEPDAVVVPEPVYYRAPAAEPEPPPPTESYTSVLRPAPVEPVPAAESAVDPEAAYQLRYVQDPPTPVEYVQPADPEPYEPPVILQDPVVAAETIDRPADLRPDYGEAPAPIEALPQEAEQLLAVDPPAEAASYSEAIAVSTSEIEVPVVPVATEPPPEPPVDRAAAPEEPAAAFEPVVPVTAPTPPPALVTTPPATPAPKPKRKPARRVARLTEPPRPLPPPLPIMGPRLTPLAIWARAESDDPARPPATDANPADELRELAESRRTPPQVWAVSYPRGCRIRRVRVPRKPPEIKADDPLVILSKKALHEVRHNQ
jgi:hypothetical protein